MGVARLQRDEVVAATVDALGLDAGAADLETPEVLAAIVRRAASFLCPITPRALVQSVGECLDGLVAEDRPETRNSLVGAMLEDLVAYGDLVEAPIDDERSGASRRLLFLAQPSYVPLSRSTFLLVGVRPDGLTLGDTSLDDQVDYHYHARRITLGRAEEPAEVLGGLGLRELSVEQWLRHPPIVTAAALVEQYSARLVAAGPSGSVEGVRVLDPTTPVTYYRGRWRAATKRDSGRFVGRRPIQFGADQWCYCDLVDGEVIRLVDLPALDRLDRGCDEAWRLQAATDTLSGTPQLLRVRPGRIAGEVVFQFRSPIPSWGQRRLDALGQPLGRQPGSLFAYKLSETLIDPELEFLKETMWLHRERESEAK